MGDTACGEALKGSEFGTEETELLLVMLADFVMLGFEIVEGLADDVEFIHL
jgi:hypothetical protein